MYLHAIEPNKTPALLHARLSEGEKIDLRRATPGAVEHLFYATYRHEVATVEDLMEVKALCEKDMSDYTNLPNLDAHHGRIPSLWKF